MMKCSVRPLSILLALLLSIISPSAWAVLCSEVWPEGNGLNQYMPPLVLPAFNAETYLAAANPRKVQAGDSYWLGSKSANNWVLDAPEVGTARVYIKGDLTISNNSKINVTGNPRNLVLIVVGKLIIEDSSNIHIKALVYSTQSVVIGNNPTIEGGVSAAGTLTRGNNISYDRGAIAGTDFGGLCDNPGSVDQIDHFRLMHAASGLSCNPLDVTLKACANADCSRLYEGSINAALSPSTWEGGHQRYFSGGQTALKLRGVGEVTLGISTVTPAAKHPLRCDTPGCKVFFAESGFIFDVPDLLAGKPRDGIALQAVRAVPGDPQRCVPGFGPATRTLQVWSKYVDPDTGSLPVQVNGGPVSANEAAPSSLTLNFDDTATAYLAVRYGDAGQMRLNVRYIGSQAESGLDMLGTDDFFSRPYGFHIASPGQNSICSAASVAGCAPLSLNGERVMAGDDFDLNIRAVAWQNDGEPRTEVALRDNPTTPNFRLNGIKLDAVQEIPAGGQFEYQRHDGSWALLAGGYNHTAGSLTLKVRQREVGIFQISASPPAYHGQSIGGGQSGLIGRFTPAYLGVTSDASLTPTCGAFSYQGQPIGFVGGHPGIVVTGFNRQKAVTYNYDRESFWRLAPPKRQAYLFSEASKPGLVARLQSLGEPQSLAVTDSGAADGSRAFDWRAVAAVARQADALQWQLASPPTAEDVPFVLSAAGEHVQLKLAAGELRDLDGICYRGGVGSSVACQDFVHVFGGTEVRRGRLRIDAASGPENQPLDLPYWLENWQESASGPVFGATFGDACSLAALGQVELSGFTGDLQASHFPTPPGTLEAASGTPLPNGFIRLPAPNQRGSVLASLSALNGAPAALPWLQFDWDGNGTLRGPSARATFGMYSGPRALIFRREVYR